jgi:hypothetical protein
LYAVFVRTSGNLIDDLLNSAHGIGKGGFIKMEDTHKKFQGAEKIKRLSK